MEEAVEGDEVAPFEAISVDEPFPAREEDPEEDPEAVGGTIWEEPLKDGMSQEE